MILGFDEIKRHFHWISFCTRLSKKCYVKTEQIEIYQIYNNNILVIIYMYAYHFKIIEWIVMYFYFLCVLNKGRWITLR